MRISPLVLLGFTVLGCGSGTQPAKPSAEPGGNQAQPQKVATPEKQAASPTEKTSAEKILDVTIPAEKPPAAKVPAEKAATAKTPAVTAVKTHMAPAQLAMGEPVVNSIGMKLALIPAGEFQMGGPDSDSDTIDRDKLQHLVKITKPFYLSVYEVTQQQYEKIMGTRPWQGKENVQEGPDYPATWVTWNDAMEFCRKLSEKEGVEYRLPTEAQWEYTCRAGTTTVYSFGGDGAKLGQHAWYDKNAWDIGEQYAHRVGQKLPNAWGLYDMHGNVFEWCHDRFGRFGSEAAHTDPVGPAQGTRRVLRGGSFNSSTLYARSANRSSNHPDNRNNYSGFRPVRTYTRSR